jgi:NAD(P)-dependent dehydrogenase (short-subunit alcohol dehydrogenase family)
VPSPAVTGDTAGHDEVALVIAGHSGIGQAVVRRLVAGGFRVMIGARRPVSTVSLCAELGPAVSAVRCDVTDTDSVLAATAAARQHFGPVTVMVNAAGAEAVQPFLTTAEDDWAPLVDVNFLGAVRCSRAVLTGMLERGRGRIVHITSEAAVAGSKGQAVYSAAKAAVAGYVAALAVEIGTTPVTVNCVAPGPTETELFRTQMLRAGDAYGRSLKRAVPMRRFADPDEIASAVDFLVSDRAGGITGQQLSVGGGVTMS